MDGSTKPTHTTTTGGRYVAILERAAGVPRPTMTTRPPPPPAASAVPPMLALAKALLERLTLGIALVDPRRCGVRGSRFGLTRSIVGGGSASKTRHPTTPPSGWSDQHGRTPGLVADEVVAFAERADHDRLADELAEVVGGLHVEGALGGELSRGLVDRDDVAGVFASDDARLAILLEALRP